MIRFLVWAGGVIVGASAAGVVVGSLGVNAPTRALLAFGGGAAFGVLWTAACRRWFP